MMQEDQLLRLPAVIEKVSMSKPHIYRLIAKGEFPSQHRLSERVSVWKASEIDEWIKNVH